MSRDSAYIYRMASDFKFFVHYDAKKDKPKQQLQQWMHKVTQQTKKLCFGIKKQYP